MDNNYFKGVYQDFFGIENKKYDGVSIGDEEVKYDGEKDFDKLMSDSFQKIDKLFIDEDSKNLLKQIIEYIRKYHEKIETNYVGFNFTINTDNNEIIDTISSIIRDVNNTFSYVSNNKFNEVSLYKLDNVDDLSKIYNENGIILIKDLKALDMNDDNFKKKFIHELDINSSDKITILCSNKEYLDLLFQYDEELRDKYFEINIYRPDINEVYNELLSKISGDLDDKMKIDLLDYISATYEKSDLEYSKYVDNLYKEIVFKKKIPEVEATKSMDEIFKDLNELVGLEKVKKSLYDLVDLIGLKNKDDKIKINDVNLHMVFLGNPGTGKTTVARILSGILYNLGYIKQNKLIEVSSKDLVAEYVGQTAPKTMAVVERAMGGILFIDEAYSLAVKQGGNSYNEEAIATLIKAMEDYRDNLVVIFAGYTKEMNDFLNSNSGIVSRIGYTLEFDDYTDDELIQILEGMAKKNGFKIDEKAISKVRGLIGEYRTSKNFGNARFIRNLYEKSIIKHATNTKDKKKKDILRTITEDDISVEGLLKDY